MKQLDESHIFITEKHITRKPICMEWELGNTLKIVQAFDPSGRNKSNILILPVSFSQSPSTIKIIFLQ